MTLQLKDEEKTQKEWNRKARDTVNQVVRRIMGLGPTIARPATPTDGQMFYDRTLKKPVWWNTEDGQWKDATGTAA
jgi:hypothetical protein